FLRLLGDRLVGNPPPPDLAAALDRPRHRDASGFDLTVGQPARFGRLQPVVAERDLTAAPRLAAHAAALLLAELHFLRHQHSDKSFSWMGRKGGTGWKE